MKTVLLDRYYYWKTFSHCICFFSASQLHLTKPSICLKYKAALDDNNNYDGRNPKIKREKQLYGSLDYIFFNVKKEEKNSFLGNSFCVGILPIVRTLVWAQSSA